MMTENEQKMLNNFLTFLKMPTKKDLHLDKLYWFDNQCIPSINEYVLIPEIGLILFIKSMESLIFL